MTFQQRTLPDIDLDAPADALAGRLILLHFDDPAPVLTELTRYVRPGGVVTFQDISVSRARSVPEVPLWTRLTEWISAGATLAGAGPDFGDRLPAIFRRAGLPNPSSGLGARAVNDRLETGDQYGEGTALHNLAIAYQLS